MKATLALAALVTAAVMLLMLAPAALAERPDDRGGLLGAGAVQAASTPARPDDRPGPRGPGPAQIVIAGEPRSGFDWGAAGVGALGAIGLCLLVATGLQLVARERGRHAAA